jgi:hypothetical protein
MSLKMFEKPQNTSISAFSETWKSITWYYIALKTPFRFTYVLPVLVVVLLELLMVTKVKSFIINTKSNGCFSKNCSTRTQNG